MVPLILSWTAKPRDIGCKSEVWVHNYSLSLSLNSGLWSWDTRVMRNLYPHGAPCKPELRAQNSDPYTASDAVRAPFPNPKVLSCWAHSLINLYLLGILVGIGKTSGKKTDKDLVWWYMPVIPVLGRLRQEGCWVWGQPELHSKTLSFKNRNIRFLGSSGSGL
jgi:hypothetical protein